MRRKQNKNRARKGRRSNTRGNHKHSTSRGIPVRNKNVMYQLLESGTSFNNILIAQNLTKDHLTTQIINMAEARGISIQATPYDKMPKGRSGTTSEVILGYLSQPDDWTFSKLIAELSQTKTTPLFIVANRINFSNNIGSIARTALAAGVNGIFYQGEQSDFINEETVHFSTGAILRIPTIKMNIFQVLKELKKLGIKTFALDMDGSTYYKEKLTGAAAFILGEESTGLSPAIINECDSTLSIPMKNNVESLNVSISSAIILNERMRQQNS